MYDRCTRWGMRLKQAMGSAAPAPGEKLEPIPMEAPPPRVQRELKPTDVSPETAREIVKRIREAETAGQR